MILAPSPNFDDRPADLPVDMLVLHYTGMPSREAALARLADPEAKVSAHYLIDEQGEVYALVGEARRAWHAGRSWWRGATDINGRSIGIELVNPGHEFGYRAFPQPQMQALAELAAGILARHPIPARNVVGHADVAPTRKDDPGELFDWRGLAARGIGLWPEGDGGKEVGLSRLRGDDEAPIGTEWVSPPPDEICRLLSLWGFQPAEEMKPALVAFQRHFRASRFDGEADAETIATLKMLLALVGEE